MRLTAFCILLAITSYGQPSEDSLSKYSYTIIGVNKSSDINSGTCFFIKNNRGLFLITAAHNFYRCDSSINKMIRKTLLGIIEVPGSPSKILQVGVPEIFDTCLQYEKDTDLVVIKIGYLWAKYVNTVEKLIAPLPENMGDIVVFGQGIENKSSIKFMPNHKIIIPKGYYTMNHNAPNFFDRNYTDWVHYFIQSDSLNLGSWAKGFSGSPVFVQDKNKNKWFFCGIFIGGYSNHPDFVGGMIITKPDIINLRIDDTLK